MLQNLSSLFEIFVGFNLAYVLSDSFNQTLNQQIVSGYALINSTLTKIDSKIEVAQENIKLKLEEALANNDTVAAEIAKKSEEERNTFESKFAILKGETKSKIEKSSNNKNFRYISLFSALYCLFTLLIIGFENKIIDLKIAYLEIFLLFNLFSFVFVVLMNTNSIANCGYHKTIKIFLWMAVVTIIIFLIQAKYCPTHVERNGFYFLNTAFCLLIPNFHFFIALRRASRNSTKYSPQMVETLKEFEADFERFNNSISTKFSFYDGELKPNFVITKKAD